MIPLLTVQNNLVRSNRKKVNIENPAEILLLEFVRNK